MNGIQENGRFVMDKLRADESWMKLWESVAASQ